MEQIAATSPDRPVRLTRRFRRGARPDLPQGVAKRASERYSTAYEMAEDLRFYLDGHSEDKSTGGNYLLPSSQPATPPSSLSSNPTLSLGSKSRSYPRGCGRSTNTTPISSSSSCPARAIATVCPKACGSGSDGSRRPTPTRRPL